MTAIQLNEFLAIPYIDSFYSEFELKDIMYELAFLCKNNKLKPSILTGTAVEDSGLPRKKNSGVFLDTVYNDRNMSDILRANRKLADLEIRSNFPCMKALKFANYDTTLISYYENSDYYKAHVDYALLTVLTYFYIEPKAFEGGDLYLPEYDVTLPCVHNRVYFIPSLIEHEVTPIRMHSENEGRGLGRYCMSQFLHCR